MFCYKCHFKLDTKKIGFRDTCEKCLTDLHVCKNCKYYSIGKPNDCSYPNTEYVSDREKNNFLSFYHKKDSLEKIIQMLLVYIKRQKTIITSEENEQILAELDKGLIVDNQVQIYDDRIFQFLLEIHA